MKPAKLLGAETPGDKKVIIPQRVWDAMKLALWRSKNAWETVAVESKSILDQCVHLEGCPAATDETVTCSGVQAMKEAFKMLDAPHEGEELTNEGLTFVHGKPEVCCPDREKRLSALVIYNTAKQCAPVDAKRLADGPYWAPSRESFSETIAELAAAQVELEELRAKLGMTTKELP